MAVLDSSVLVPVWSRFVLQRLAARPSPAFTPVWVGWHSSLRSQDRSVHNREEPADAGRGIPAGDVVMASETTIAEAVRRLVAAARPRKVILFGSHARGEARPDSDLDFLVVEREAPDTVAEMVRLRRALRGLNVAADVIVVSEADVAAWGDLPGSPLYEPLREGLTLHEAAD